MTTQTPTGVVVVVVVVVVITKTAEKEADIISPGLETAMQSKAICNLSSFITKTKLEEIFFKIKLFLNFLTRTPEI